MKFIRATSLIFVLFALAAPVLPAGAACSCTCNAIETVLTSPGGGPGSIPTSTSVQKCSGAPAKVTLPDQNSAQDCISACLAQTPTTGKVDMPCYQSSGSSTCESGNKINCWCKGLQGVPLKQAETSSVSDCQAACKAASREYIAWSNTPPATGGGITACPPGGIWTKEECEAVKNSYGGTRGKWELPAGVAADKGPYCVVADTPVKLGVSIGGLDSATLAQYLAAAYRLGLGIAAILAVIFIMIGGFRYLAAAGGGGIEKAKEMIKNAVIGLVLTVASYTLLQTVNPDILSLRLPRVPLIKACNLQVDCGSRHEKEPCEKNDTAGARCIWNATQSVCYDNSNNEGSSIKGQLNGPCKDDGSCVQGNCVVISSTNKICSGGQVCEACTNDTGASGGTAQGQCSTSGGKPMKCIDNMCAVMDPGGSGKYKACANSSCSNGDDCASGFCNGEKKCSQGTQGVTCLANGGDDCSTKTGYSCVEWKTKAGDTWKASCCRNGDANGCVGCGSDGDCIETMFCLDTARYSGYKKANPDLDPNLEGKCINDVGKGLPCNDKAMCQGTECVGGLCR